MGPGHLLRRLAHRVFQSNIQSKRPNVVTATTIATQQTRSAKVFSGFSITCAIPVPLNKAKVMGGLHPHNTP